MTIDQAGDHMGPEGVRNRKIPIFFVDAKFSQIARGFQKCKSVSARTESEEKATLVSENDLFLTLGSGTSGAQNENYTNIPLISGKYGLRKLF